MADNRVLIFMIALFGIVWAIVGYDAGMQYGLFEAMLLAAPGLGLTLVGGIKVARDIRREQADE